MSYSRRTFVRTVGATSVALLGAATTATATDETASTTDESRFQTGDWVASTADLNVRTGPTTEHDVLGSVTPGDRGIVLDVTHQSQYTWYKITWDLQERDDDRMTGWSAGEWLELDEPALEPGEMGTAWNDSERSQGTIMVYPEPNPAEGAITVPEAGSSAYVLEPGVVYNEHGIWYKTQWPESAVGSWKPIRGYVSALAFGR